MISNIAPRGLILAGGASSRMGEPKAWLCFSDIPQWQACERNLSSHCEEIYFSVSPKLQRALPVQEHRLVNDVFKDPCGPLGGIISAFQRFNEKAFFVLACDMPNFDARAIQFLLAHRNSERLATVFQNQSGAIEPLCGIYEPKIFTVLLEYWGQKMYCPKKILSQLNIERVVPEDYSWLANVNEPSLAVDKKVKLHFYAGLREEAQCSELEIMTKASNIAELFSEMRARFHFSLSQKSMRFAKNHQLIEPEASVSDGDSIVFIAPVSGG